MIECTKQELLDHGFVISPGLVCEALSVSDAYGIYCLNNDKYAMIVMKNELGAGTYYPHRVKFSDGHELGEDTLIYGDGEIADLENVGDLVKLITEMDK